MKQAYFIGYHRMAAMALKATLRSKNSFWEDDCSTLLAHKMHLELFYSLFYFAAAQRQKIFWTYFDNLTILFQHCDWKITNIGDLWIIA